MKHKHLRFSKGFRVAVANRHSQAAEMVIPPGEAEGDARNSHYGADQWLYVVAGTGVARVNGRRIALRAGTLVLIERRDKHEITNSGRSLLRTLNFYVPPAYSTSGRSLPRAAPSPRAARHPERT